MPEIVVEGAEILCSFCGSNVELKVQNRSTKTIGSMPIANKNDVGIKSIEHFINCRDPANSSRICTHNIHQKWVIVAENYKVDGAPIVITDSITCCNVYHGIITVGDSGQTGEIGRAHV